MLTQERLKELLRYEPETGLFYWKVSNSNRVKVGEQAGCLCKTHGYVIITIDNILYKAHRLVWFYINGEWPDGDIDHKFGVKNDNRIDNLRDVDAILNGQNLQTAHKDNKTGLLGVTLKGVRFQARIRVNGKNWNLGTFDTPIEAHNAYIEAKRKLHEGNTL